jgi:hypothetical protein
MTTTDTKQDQATDSTDLTLLQQLRGYVQAVADATPENGATLIQSAGFAVRRIPQRAARVFAAKQGPVSGSVKLTATVSARRASYGEGDWGQAIAMLVK